jgi:hypothetical protein
MRWLLASLSIMIVINVGTAANPNGAGGARATSTVAARDKVRPIIAVNIVIALPPLPQPIPATRPMPATRPWRVRSQELLDMLLPKTSNQKAAVLLETPLLYAVRHALRWSRARSPEVLAER